ncbi:MAG: hypothetical protein JW966_14185 [Anaerolineae bacterium]|nr:hypothetical protein [Anaerolineae bacterium]
MNTTTYQSRLIRTLWIIGLAWVLSGCSSLPDAGNDSSANNSAVPTAPPTPNSNSLQLSGIQASGARLRITIPSLKLLKRPAGQPAQLFFIMTDADGTYTYLLYPANRPGDTTDDFDLSEFPLELSLSDESDTVTLWALAVHNTRYSAAEMFGLEALASSLAVGFRDWLANGDPDDDPLAAVVAASDGALYDWFAEVEVLGQNVTTLHADNNWYAGLHSERSPDGGLSIVYTLHTMSAEEASQLPIPPTATPIFPAADHPGYILHIDETFADGVSDHRWYQGYDSTFTNQIVDGAYEIKLTSILTRPFARSWGSIEDATFSDYIVEAQVSLVENMVRDGRYGIWFHYKDDYNFVYFGISNQGEYRVAVQHRATPESPSSAITIRDWTAHSAIRTGAATNLLTIEASKEGMITLGINGQEVLTFIDQTFFEGSVAFFCYAESVPTTCHLNRIRVWER